MPETTVVLNAGKLTPTNLPTKLILRTNTVDLRPEITAMGLPVKAQGGRGTCSVFACTFLIEYMTCREQKLKQLDFSEEYLNAVTNLAGFNNTAGDGDFFHAIVEGYRQFGIVSETEMPYQQAFDPTLKPSDELLETGKEARILTGFTTIAAKPSSASPRGLDETQLAAVLEQLDHGTPVAIGFHGSDTTTTVKFGSIVALDDMTDDTSGAFAHSVPLVGYVASPKLAGGGGYFIYRDSGGAAAGDKGYGYMTFDYVRQFVYDFAVFHPQPLRLPKLVVRKMTKRPPLRFSNRFDRMVLAKKINPRSRVV